MRTMTQTNFFSMILENTKLSYDKHDLFMHYNDFAKRLSAFHTNESSPLENISSTNFILVELYIIKEKAINILNEKKILKPFCI